MFGQPPCGFSGYKSMNEFPVDPLASPFRLVIGLSGSSPGRTPMVSFGNRWLDVGAFGVVSTNDAIKSGAGLCVV
jgi:hypothetical protein